MPLSQAPKLHAAVLLVILLLSLRVPTSPGAVPARSELYLLPSGRTIRFAGMTWGVRSGTGSPGGNTWDDSLQSVWVDSKGQLHLKIRKVEDIWTSAEIFSYEFARYGEHRFTVVSQSHPLDQLDPNVVLGLFLFKTGCGDGCEAELDMEFSRWGDAASPWNAQYVVQPAKLSTNRHRFSLPPSQPVSTHRISWQKTQVRFSSHLGADFRSLSSFLQSWSYSGDKVPLERDNLKIILNLWLDNGLPPENEEEVEVIIADAAISGVCLPATRISCGETVFGSTFGSGSRSQISSYRGSTWDQQGPEIVYAFTAPDAGKVNLLLTPHSNDLDIFVLDGSNGACRSSRTTAFGNEVATFEAEEGRTYYFAVDGHLRSGGKFDLQVDCSGDVPPEDPPKPPHLVYLPNVHR
jgi:hypothetical protein